MGRQKKKRIQKFRTAIKAKQPEEKEKKPKKIIF